jgi:hypothetical protein
LQLRPWPKRATGVALIIVPSLVVRLLLGAELIGLAARRGGRIQHHNARVLAETGNAPRHLVALASKAGSK